MDVGSCPLQQNGRRRGVHTTGQAEDDLFAGYLTF
jgi:hypothetical protein